MNELAYMLPPQDEGDGTSFVYENVHVTVLPGPGVLKADFLERATYDEVYIVPDEITLIQLHGICKVLLNMK